MEADLVAQRCALFWLSRRHPEWTYAELAAHVGRSESWVSKWLARLKHATTPDLTLFQSRSHARHTPSPSTSQPVVERILALRDEPPAHLRRVPGPRTLLALLHRDPEALALALSLPRSSRTVWPVLRRSGRSEADLPPVHQPLFPPAPLEAVQADFPDVGTVPPDPFGKRQHAVEALLFADVGSRHVVYAERSSDFPAQTALAAVIACLRRTGLLGKLTFDHDPRWVGSPSGRDFKSALIRFLLWVGGQPNVCRLGGRIAQATSNG